MQVVLRELGNARVEMTGREWMVLLLGLCGDKNDRMIEAVKEFLEKMWHARRVAVASSSLSRKDVLSYSVV
ncbi:hypothetical protein E2C01_059159 [Portunus trituberculatus]|uniref:Uncharacterized protein n=1 Tax=Portunus trituberculatus TaxID=210409 RepID=A0A5B7H627_PORTR|nr:hypothetical protein [Portunus trituberculatus]